MLPPLTSEILSDEGLRWAFTVPAQTPFFQGHFPGHPILPGVVALQWMLLAAARWQDVPLESITVANVKFRVVIEPGACIELNVERKSAAHLQASIRSAAGIHATALIPVGEA
jgi:3-hydroxymyristoyl/3-hydroxydecanoyl-(acyl carrier protein) dehydratase